MVFERNYGRSIMLNTTTDTVAINILNTITELKLQKTVEEYFVPNSISQSELKRLAEKEMRADAENCEGISLEELMAEIAEEQPTYRRNPELVLPDFLDVRETALFLYMLLTYWGNQGVKAVPDCGDKLTEIRFKPMSSCYRCRSGAKFVKKLFGKNYRKLPFIKDGIYDSYIVITAKSLREFTYS